MLDATGAGGALDGVGDDGPSEVFTSLGGGGGGYGGLGGKGGKVFAEVADGGMPYGDPVSKDIRMGSAGGSARSGPGVGGAGGGAITIIANAIAVSGTIRASGVVGADGTPGGGGGGGSGGGILLDGSLNVTGVIEAKGGAAGSGLDGPGGPPFFVTFGTGGGGGGGGRIKVFGCGIFDPTTLDVGGGDPGLSGTVVELPTAGASGTTSVTLEACPSSAASTFLIIDEESIGKGSPPNSFDEADVNEDMTDIGLRTPLPFFAGANVGLTITLHTGEVGDEGWFAVKTIPDSWGSTPDDGLRNYLDAGPGLGSGGDPEALLDKIPDVTPLRATGLKQLVGQRVCAVVYKGDVSINYDPLDGSLKGDNLGTVAFEVLSVTRLDGFSSSSLPEVEIEILDADDVCEGSLTLFTDAPEPISSSEPLDVDPSP